MKSDKILKLREKAEALSDKQKVILMVFFLLTGVLMVFGGSFFNDDASGVYEPDGTNEYKIALENQLEKMLSSVSGVGEVKVMITLEGENSKTIAYNESLSASVSNDSSREDVSKDAVLIKEGATSTPYTLNEYYPDVAGVLVVACGAENSLCKSYIISAVRSTLNVSANNITVLPMGDSGK